MPHIDPKLVFYEKRIESDGSIIEMKIWEVPASEKNPDGVKYSFYWVKNGKTVVGYDNHHPKGHHRHYGTREETYEFTTIENLVGDFLEDRERILNESQKN